MPMLGEIRSNFPPDTRLEDIIEFEVWFGDRWVPASEAKNWEFILDKGRGDIALRVPNEYDS